MTGEFDAAFCEGNYTGILEPPPSYFPNARDFQAVVHPSVGHGINFSTYSGIFAKRNCKADNQRVVGYNATGAYAVMLDYLKKHGL